MAVRISVSLICLWLLLGIVPAQSQTPSFQLAGQVLDAQTEKPLAFANVFIANTTKGSITDAEGGFLLEEVPGGLQELVFSYVGYKTVVKKVQINKLLSQQVLKIKLKPLAIELSEVVVETATGKKRKRYLKKFTRAFLGNTDNAKSCRILNPEVLDFRMRGDTLQATAADLIEIENNSLGYQVRFYLEKFELNNDQVVYGGKPLFQELGVKTTREQKQRKQQRDETFAGSASHFFQALAKG